MKAVQNISLLRMMATGLILMMVAGCAQQATVDEAEVAVQQESDRLASEMEAMEQNLALLYQGEKITHPPRLVDRLRVDQINGLLAGRYAIDEGNYAEGIEKLEALFETELNTNEQGDAWGLIAYEYYIAGDFDASIDETGNVKNPVVVENCAVLNEGDKPQCAHSPSAIFDQAALNAIRQSKYEAVVIDGVATASQALTRVEFWLSPTTNESCSGL